MGRYGGLGKLSRSSRDVGRGVESFFIDSVLIEWRIRLNEEITAFYDYVSPTRTEYEVRLFVIELIIKAVKNTWPEADISPFGSWQTQLYLPTGYVLRLSFV